MIPLQDYYPLEDFYPLVLPFAPECPLPFVDFHLVMTAREICERTHTWRTVDKFISSGEKREEVAIMPNSAIHMFEFVTFNDAELCALSYETAYKLPAIGYPVGYTQDGMNRFSLVPPAVGEIKVSAILKPSVNADALPDFLLDIYAQEIADGTTARILMLPGQTWSNPSMGTLHRANFNSAMDRNFMAGMRGQQLATVRTKSDFF